MLFDNLIPKEEAAKQNEFRVLPEALYPFQVMEAEETRFNSGNSGIKLKIKIWETQSINSYSVIISDCLINIDKMSWKTLHFLRSIKLEDLYNSKSISCQAILRKKGIVKIKIEEYINNAGEKKNSNKVADYVLPENNLSTSVSTPAPTMAAEVPPINNNDFPDEDVPF